MRSSRASSGGKAGGLPPEAVSFSQFLWLWNRLQGLPTPSLHLDIAQWLSQRWRNGDRRLALLVFRHAGKSTLVAVFCAWLLSRNADLRILVLAAEHELARKMVMNVRRIIERHPLTRRLVPKRAEQWAADCFTVVRERDQRDPSLMARGIHANITGAHADVVICDDVEVPNTAATPHKRADLRQRLRELSYILSPDGTQLFIGTPHAYDTIYPVGDPQERDDEGFLSGYDALVLPVLNEHGTSRWPERFDLDAIQLIERQSGPAKFASQMLLRPSCPQDVRLDPSKLQRYDAALRYREANGECSLWIEGHRLVSASCWWDPAYGAPGSGDASVVAAVFVDENGAYWLHGLRYLEHDPDAVAEIDEATQLCRQVAAFARELRLPSVTIETNGLGRFLPALLRREMHHAGVGCAVVERASTAAKAQRILDAFDPVLAARVLHAHADVWSTPFIEEMREWQPTGRQRDDALDAVSGCLLSEPVRLPQLAPMSKQRWRLGTTQRDGAEFDV